MIENEGDTPRDDNYEALKARAEALERQLREVESHATRRLRETELKAEAVRAGIVDLDGLRLLDPAVLSGGGEEGFDATDVVTRLRRDKPWLFGAPSSSSSATVPTVAPVKRRLATEMSLEEWRAARAELLRRR